MLIHVKKINLILSLLMLVCHKGVLAQEASQATGTPAREAEKKETGAAAMDYLFNNKPKDGTAAKNVADIAAKANDKSRASEAFQQPHLGDPQLEARFDKFLGAPEIPQDRVKAYMSEYSKILDLLKNQQKFVAWQHLFALAEYQDIDAGISRELANRIESIWNVDKASKTIQKTNQELREAIDKANWSVDLSTDEVRKRDLDYQRRLSEINSKKESKKQGTENTSTANPLNPPGSSTGTVSGATADISSLMGKLQLTEDYLSSLEAKAKIKLNELKIDKMAEQAKTDFAEYISILHSGRRFYHVVLAAEFYRKIFDESDYPVTIANKVNSSLEVNRDIASTVDVYKYKISKQEINGAMGRLQEAFVGGEFHPMVMGVTRESKEMISSYLAKLSVMQNLLESREFGRLEEMIGEVKKSCADFDSSKASAIVNAVKLESKMRLGKAKLAAQQGNHQMAMEEFQAAAQAWPGNPELQNAASTFFESQDVKNQAITDFDRLVTNADHRALFEGQLGFATAVRGDQKRIDQLKASLEKVKKAEVASEKASLLMLNGDVYGAWEAIEFAVKDWPEDSKLNRLRADLTTKATEFVSSINKAKEAEGKKEYGYSLTWYVNAQRQYPASQIANEAIERIGKSILQSKASKDS